MLLHPVGEGSMQPSYGAVPEVQARLRRYGDTLHPLSLPALALHLERDKDCAQALHWENGAEKALCTFSPVQTDII